jgi:SAM-dependent methyltransferase
MADFGEFLRMEREGWGEMETASAYANGFAAAAEQCVPAMVKAVGAAKGVAALDLCCGHGIVAKGLSEAGAEVTGIDFAPAMLELARQRAPGVTFVEGDATALAYQDDSVDAVTMGFGILHIPDSIQALAEIKRVLRPGGKFAYSVWHGPEISAAFRIVFGKIQKHGDPSIVLPPGPAIHDYADKDFAFAALESAGFSDPHLQTIDSYWTLDDPGIPYDHFLEGTVRGAALLRSQPKANQDAIRTAIGDAVKREFGSTGPWQIPIPAAIVSATS